MMTRRLNQEDTRQIGIERGYDAGRHCISPVISFVALLESEDHWHKLEEEYHQDAMETEENARQYSDFTRFASLINEQGENESEELWNAYECGVLKGIAIAFDEAKEKFKN